MEEPGDMFESECYELSFVILQALSRRFTHDPLLIQSGEIIMTQMNVVTLPTCRVQDRIIDSPLLLPDNISITILLYLLTWPGSQT